MPEPLVNTSRELRRLLSRPPSPIARAAAPDLYAALPGLVEFLGHVELLAERVRLLELQRQGATR